ncbi:MAG: hypothetical protein ACLFM0_03830 [Spirochaetales bacterium]
MFLFTIKKAFFDLWDNLLTVALLNVGFVALLALTLSLTNLFGSIDAFVGAILVPVAAILVTIVYAGGVSFASRDMVDYENPEFRQLIGYFREALPSSLWLAGLYIVQFFITSIAVPFYAQIENIWGLAALVFLFWVSVVWLLASQFFLPIRSRLDSRLKPILKKCFIVFFDNTGFSVLTAIGVLALTAISVPLAFLIPGPAGVMLWLQSSFKIRLMKYDYLEANPDADRRKIPWERLLIEEQQKVGKRTFRGMIFPWRE